MTWQVKLWKALFSEFFLYPQQDKPGVRDGKWERSILIRESVV